MSVADFIRQSHLSACTLSQTVLANCLTFDVIPLSSVEPDSLGSLEYVSSGLRFDCSAFIIIYE